MAILTKAEVERALAGLDGWASDGMAISKEFTFAGFPEAVAFVSQLVPDAEGADHHPDIAIHHRRVRVSFTTHSEGGITPRDIAGARAVEHQMREAR